MWLYENKEFVLNNDEHVGFVYIIENLINGRKYIGKKLFKFTRTKKRKNKRRKKIKFESDWMEYYGSNDELLADIANLGVENFRRTIIRLCSSKGECSYYEAKHILESDAIISNEYYNSWLSVKVRKSHLTKIEK